MPGREVRGEHAHRICEQFSSACGRVGWRSMTEAPATSPPHSPAVGLYIPAPSVGQPVRLRAGHGALGAASHPYNPADYIREYETFLGVAAAGSAGFASSPKLSG